MNDLPSYSGGFSVTGGIRETPLDSVREIWRFRPLITELVKRDLKVRYKNRVGGILWSLFPPLMRVLTIHLMVKFFLSPVAGYSGYLLPVMFLWQYFQNCVLDASQSLIINAQLARKIYFPRAILPIVTTISNLIHFGISLGFMVVYFFIIPISDPVFPQNLTWKLLLVVPMVAAVTALGLGIGYLLAYANTLYDDVRFLTQTFLELFFYAVPILYPIEKVAVHSQLFRYYMLNPIASLLVGFQRSFLPPIAVPAPPVHLPWASLGVLTCHSASVSNVLSPLQMPWVYLGIAATASVLVLMMGFSIFERSKWMMMERL